MFDFLSSKIFKIIGQEERKSLKEFWYF